jgi:hypothetical protein
MRYCSRPIWKGFTARIALPQMGAARRHCWSPRQRLLMKPSFPVTANGSVCRQGSGTAASRRYAARNRHRRPSAPSGLKHRSSRQRSLRTDAGSPTRRMNPDATRCTSGRSRMWRARVRRLEERGTEPTWSHSGRTLLSHAGCGIRCGSYLRHRTFGDVPEGALPDR